MIELDKKSVNIFLNFCHNYTGLRKQSMKQGEIGFTRILEYLLTFEHIREYQKSLPKNSIITVLDIGSNYTIYPLWLLYNKLDVTVLDLPSEKDKLKLYYNLPLVKKYHKSFKTISADIRKYRFRQKFDFISVISTIEHIPGEMYVVKKLAKNLNPGARMFLTFPVAHKLHSFRKPYLIRCYDEKSIFKRLVVPSGLKLIELKYFKCRDNSIGFYQRYREAVEFCYRYMDEVETTNEITETWPLNTGLLVLEKT